MNKTSNYQLNQWAKEDRIMMDDFNRDNANLEAALTANAGAIAAEETARIAAVAAEETARTAAVNAAKSALNAAIAAKSSITQIYTYTVPANTTSVTCNFGKGALAQYAVVMVSCQASGTEDFYINFDVGDNRSTLLGVMNSTVGSFAYGSVNSPMNLFLFPQKNGASRCNGFFHSGYSIGLCSSGTTWNDVSQLVFTGTINAGSRIFIWGIK